MRIQKRARRIRAKVFHATTSAASQHAPTSPTPFCLSLPTRRVRLITLCPRLNIGACSGSKIARRCREARSGQSAPAAHVAGVGRTLLVFACAVGRLLGEPRDSGILGTLAVRDASGRGRRWDCHTCRLRGVCMFRNRRRVRARELFESGAATLSLRGPCSSDMWARPGWHSVAAVYISTLRAPCEAGSWFLGLREATSKPRTHGRLWRRREKRGRDGGQSGSSAHDEGFERNAG